MSSPVLLALFDIPMSPLFALGIFLFHPWLGYLALAGGTFLILLTVINMFVSRKPTNSSNRAMMEAEQKAEQLRHEAEMVQALGMRSQAFARWIKARSSALRGQIGAADITGTFTTSTKTIRLLLQSAMLGLGALLVLRGELTPGAMIAGSILLGRALAPIEMAIGQWPLVQRAREGWDNLAQLLTEIPPEQERTALPRPRAKIDIQQLTMVPPGEQQASLRLVSFNLEPGQALGVIGTSGFRNGRSEVNDLVSKQIHGLDFYREMVRHARDHRRVASSRRPSLVLAVPRIRVRGHFAGIVLPSVVGAGPPHHAWSVGSRVPISRRVLDLAGGTSERTASSRPRPGEGTSEDRDHPDPIRGWFSA